MTPVSKRQLHAARKLARQHPTAEMHVQLQRDPATGRLVTVKVAVRNAATGIERKL